MLYTLYATRYKCYIVLRVKLILHSYCDDRRLVIIGSFVGSVSFTIRIDGPCFSFSHRAVAVWKPCCDKPLERQLTVDEFSCDIKHCLVCATCC